MLDCKPSCNYQKCLDVIKLLVATSILQHDGQHFTVYTTDGEDTKNHWDVQVLNHRWLEVDSGCLWPQLRIWNVRWIITYFAPSVDGNVTKKGITRNLLNSGSSRHSFLSWKVSWHALLSIVRIDIRDYVGIFFVPIGFFFFFPEFFFSFNERQKFPLMGVLVGNAGVFGLIFKVIQLSHLKNWLF